MTKLINYIKEEEFFKLLKAEKKDKYKLAYKLGFGSGLRISEIIGLHTLKSKCHKAELLRGRELINGVKRVIYRCAECKNVINSKDSCRDLEEWQIEPLKAEQIDLQAKTIKVVGGKGMKDRMVPLFPGFKESDLKLLPLKIKRSTLQSHFSALSNRVLGRKYNFHLLRHGFGTFSLKKGIDTRYIQVAMGHSRADTTAKYSHVVTDDLVDKYRKAWGE